MRRSIVITLCAAVLLAALIYEGRLLVFVPERVAPGIPETPVAPQNNAPPGFVRVMRVIDGDTIEVLMNNTVERVRMIGIDTPETVDPRRPVQCFGKEASAHLKSLLEGRSVQLVADPMNDDRDKYDRLLRYVYAEDGAWINAAMIRDGYVYAYITYPFEHRATFLKLQTEARAAQRGLWAPDTCNGKR